MKKMTNPDKELPDNFQVESDFILIDDTEFADYERKVKELIERLEAESGPYNKHPDLPPFALIPDDDDDMFL